LGCQVATQFAWSIVGTFGRPFAVSACPPCDGRPLRRKRSARVERSVL
jgi:hypothetical protein